MFGSSSRALNLAGASSTSAPERATSETMSRRRVLLFAAATAAIWWLACAWQIAPLGWVALVPFFLVVSHPNARVRWWRGYGIGVLCLAVIHWWLIPTITRGGTVIGAPPVAGFGLGIVAAVLIALIQGTIAGVTALLWRGHNWWLPFLAATVWTILDALRVVGPLAHGWGALAYSQTSPLILPSAFWLQMHGLTWLCVFVAACLVLAWQTKNRAFALLPIGALVLIFAVATFRTTTYNSTTQFEGSLRVLLVQTSIPSVRKREMEQREAPLTQALRLTSGALEENERARRPFDLIVWPETTLQAGRASADLHLGFELESVRMLQSGVPLLTGARIGDPMGRPFNALLLLQPSGDVSFYDKVRLVPFGERPPFVEQLPFLARFAPNPMLQKGQQKPFLTLENGVSLRPVICFESTMPLGATEADLIVVATNDEWFAGTEALRQHRAMGLMRAAEAGVPLVQSCNGAYSFAADATGRIIASTHSSSAQTLSVEVPLRRTSRSPVNALLNF